MTNSKFFIFLLFALSFVGASACTNSSSAPPPTEYAQVCSAANNGKDVAVQGFLAVSDKVPCMNMLRPKRDCAFKFLDKVNVTGNEIIVYLQEGGGNNEADTPEAGKSAFDSKPTSVFTRDQIKFRLFDGTLITPQADVATPVTVMGKVSLTDGSGAEKICSIMANRIEKR